MHMVWGRFGAVCLLLWLAVGCDDGDGGASADAAAPDAMAAGGEGGEGGEGGAGGMGGEAGAAGMGGMGGEAGAAGMGGMGGGGGVNASAPIIETAQAFLNRADGGFGFILTGKDPENDVGGFTFQAWDAQDRAMFAEVDEDGNRLVYQFDNLRQGLGDFLAVFSISFSIDGRFSGLQRVRVGVADRAGNFSAEAVEPMFMDTPEVDRDENCDPNRGLSRCYEGDLCGTLAGGRYSCQPDAVECPEYFMALDLNAERNVDGSWSYQGDTDGAGSHARGHCGGGAGDQVFRFVPPAAGDYVIRTEVPDAAGDTLIYVRSHCAFPDVIAELGCNDDVTPGRVLISRLELTLPADEPVFIFVDGFDTGDEMEIPWRGRYTLFVEPAP